MHSVRGRAGAADYGAAAPPDAAGARAASAPGAIEADARANSTRQFAGASIAPAASTPAQVAAGHLNALLDRSEPGRLLSTTAQHWGKGAPAPRAAAHALRRPPPLCLPARPPRCFHCGRALLLHQVGVASAALRQPAAGLARAPREAACPPRPTASGSPRCTR